MAKWAPFPYGGEYNFDATSIKKKWTRLHAGDLEPLPQDQGLLKAWAHFHNGDFHQAATLGLSMGQAGLNVANKATCIYATYLEKQETRRLELFLEVADRAEQHIELDPENINARYLRAYALGRYSQGISVAKALAQGLGSKIKTDLEKVIRSEPKHPEAHIALGTFHAEVIDKVGALVGGLTYGAKKTTGNELLETALKLNPDSAITRIEYANALVMMFGKARMKDAERLYQEAAAFTPMDAMERLDVEAAKEELAD